MNKELLENYINKGLSSYQIGKELSLSQTNIIYWLKKYNLKTKRSKEKIEQSLSKDKQCPLCKNIYPNNSSFFYLRSNKKAQHFCKKCSNIKTVERLRKYKEQCVKYKGGKCVKCSYHNCVDALEFHHLDPNEKEISIANSNKSFERLKPELDKCILLCSICHREFHAGLFEITNEMVVPVGLEPTSFR